MGVTRPKCRRKQSTSLFFFLPWLTCCHFILQIALLYLSAGRPQLTNKKKIVLVPAVSVGGVGLLENKHSQANRERLLLVGVCKGWGGGVPKGGGGVDEGGRSQMVRPESAPTNLPHPWVFPHISQAAVDTSPQRPVSPLRMQIKTWPETRPGTFASRRLTGKKGDGDSTAQTDKREPRDKVCCWKMSQCGSEKKTKWDDYFELWATHSRGCGLGLHESSAHSLFRSLSRTHTRQWRTLEELTPLERS